jgi:hypothetical protein
LSCLRSAIAAPRRGALRSASSPWIAIEPFERFDRAELVTDLQLKRERVAAERTGKVPLVPLIGQHRL